MGLDLPSDQERPPFGAHSTQGTSEPSSAHTPVADSALTLGRTNQSFHPVWLSLSVPGSMPGEQADLRSLVDAALRCNTVVDISVHPGLFGGFIRGTQQHDSALLMGRGGLDLENAADAKNASDLIQAHLIETLSAIGREYLDFYFLRVRSPLEEYQVEGALEALEMARQEGHIRFIGLASEGKTPLPALGLWQFHDAFEAVLLPPSQDGLATLAQERRVGVVWHSLSPVQDFEANLAAFDAMAPTTPTLFSVNCLSQIELLQDRFPTLSRER